MNRTNAVFASLILLLGCTETTSPKTHQTIAADDAPGVTGLQRLALEDPKGTTGLDEQIRRLQRTSKNHPTKLDPWVLLGRSWVKKARQESDPGLYKNANACADIGFDIQPENPLSMNLRGLVLMNDHRFEETKVLMEKVLAKDSDDIMALGTLSDALLELGDFDAASKLVQRMIDLKPSLPAYTRAGYVRWLEGDPDGAKTILRKAIMAAGTSRDKEVFGWVLVEAAKIFYHQGDHDGAEAGLDKALESFEEYPPALLWKARIALGRGDNKAALDLAKRSYKVAALAETAWVWVDAARAAGDEASAKEAEEKLIKLGEHGEARVLAAYYATENREPERAVALAERELKGRGDIYTHDAHAWALYRKGDFDAALAAAKKATRHGTKDAQLLYHLGAIQLAKGDKAEGRKNIEMALKINPKWHLKSAAEARALLGK